MQKKTVMSIWGIYGILAIAGTVGSYIWATEALHGHFITKRKPI